MSQLHNVLGISRQSFYQKVQRMRLQQKKSQSALPQVLDVRKNHPHMSAREMYFKIRPEGLGRDKFEQFCFREGFRVRKKKNYRKTTDSRGVSRFENLIKDRELTGVNQVFVSDITYYDMGEQTYYLTFIMDLYNREIVGRSVSKNLRAENTTIPALKDAQRRIGKQALRGSIIHSDGGGQYYSKNFREPVKLLGMRSSMTNKDVYENAHAERLNGTIKNDYLYPYAPQTYQELQKKLKKAVYMYNYQRPHKALNRMTPVEYRRTSGDHQPEQKLYVESELKIMSNSVNVF